MSKNATAKVSAPVAANQLQGEYREIKLSDIVVRAEDNCRLGKLTGAEQDRLEESIKREGLLEPLIVRKVPTTKTTPSHLALVVGYRRFAAVKHLGWETVPCKVVDISAQEALIVNLTENSSRKDLTPPEYAERLYTLHMQGITPVDLASMTGLSASHVYNMIRLRKDLTPEVFGIFKSPVDKIESPVKAEDGPDSNEPKPAKVSNWKVARFLKVAAAKPQDQLALLKKLSEEEGAKVPLTEEEKAAKKAEREAAKAEKEGDDGTDDPALSEPIAFACTQPQFKVVQKWLNDFRTSKQGDEAWIAGAQAMLSFFKRGESLEGAGSFKSLDPLK